MKTQILSELNKVKHEGMQELIKWLEESDFFEAPASTKYHGAFDGGLVEHSWNVFKLLKEKNQRYNLGLSEETIIICGLLHDVTKISFYKKYWRYSKLNNELEFYYKVEDSFPIGHSEKSIIILQKFIKLTPEEIVMIRWHMGTYELSWQNKMAFYNAVEKFPSVITMHTADLESAFLLETREK